MMISKFNKLIHNKIVWAVFAVVISLAMVGLFTPSGGGRGSVDPDAVNSVGTLFGKPVSRETFSRGRLFNQAFRTDRRTDEGEQARVREETWQRLAILELARQQGISVTDLELSETIQRDPTFATDGAFDRSRYQQLVEARMRVRVGTFEEYLREELILRKMTALVSQSLWISPYELERSVARLTDIFSIQIAEMGYSNSVTDVSATEEAVNTFYEEHPETFEIPERRSVKYIEWPISNYLATADVSEESIQDYYDAHLQDFATADTNDVTTYSPLEAVAATIRHDLAWKTAIGLASEAAMQLTDELSEMDYDKTITLESVSAAAGLNIQTSAFFAATGPVEALSVSQSFNDAAFRLKADRADESYSHTIIGDDAIYVLASHETLPAHVPPLDEVKNQAKALADENAKYIAFEERATEIRNQLAAAGNAPDAFDATATKLKLAIKTPPPFSVYETATEDMADFSSIAPAVLSLDRGEVSELVPTTNGVAIVFVVDRRPGDFAMAESLKPDVARSIQSSRMRAHFQVWAKAILKEARAGSEPEPKITPEPEDYE